MPEGVSVGLYDSVRGGRLLLTSVDACDQVGGGG